MILSDRDIAKACGTRRKHPLISPFRRSNLQPASVDLTLGSTFLEPDGSQNWIIDLDDVCGTHYYRELESPDGYMLPPNGFVLSTTVETIHVPNNMVATIEGKSSLARIGLCIHVTAGFCDPGFNGKITLEMANFNYRPIVLRPGRRICQIGFAQLSSTADAPYGSAKLGSKYQGQTTTTGSKYVG